MAQIEVTIADLTKVNFYFLEKEIAAKIGTGFAMVFVPPNKLQFIGETVEEKKADIEAAIAAHKPPTPVTEQFFIPPAAMRPAVEAKVGQTITDPTELPFYIHYHGVDKTGKVKPTADWWPKDTGI